MCTRALYCHSHLFGMTLASSPPLGRSCLSPSFLLPVARLRLERCRAQGSGVAGSIMLTRLPQCVAQRVCQPSGVWHAVRDTGGRFRAALQRDGGASDKQASFSVCHVVHTPIFPGAIHAKPAAVAIHGKHAVDRVDGEDRVDAIDGKCRIDSVQAPQCVDAAKTPAA